MRADLILGINLRCDNPGFPVPEKTPEESDDDSGPHENRSKQGEMDHFAHHSLRVYTGYTIGYGTQGGMYTTG